LSTVVKCKKTQ